MALTVQAVIAPHDHERSTHPHADQLARAVELDMREHWQPTAANYLGRVSRERVLEALREGVSPEAADNLAKLKKPALAEAATQRLDGKGWLPSLLRSPPPVEVKDVAALTA